MGVRVVIEPIATEATLRKEAKAEDIAFVEKFGAESRRREVLAWRALVRRELGSECRIFHDDCGAPKVDIPQTYISVSHSREYVAVAISEKPCAIDIESVNRDFRKVATHYLSPKEQTMAEENELYAEMWSAKEALYKYYAKGNLDFIAHIKITNYQPERGVLIAKILNSEPIEVAINREDDLVIAVIA